MTTTSTRNETLSPHERIDKLLSIPSPAQWAVLAAVLVFLGGAAAWGVMGRIPTTVPGEGILIRQEAVFDVAALGAGQVAELLVGLDDPVAEGQIIGRIRQQEMENSIAEAESLLETLKDEQRVIQKFGKESQGKKSVFLDQRRATLQAAIRFSEERLKDIRERTASYKSMAERGIVSRNEYLNSKHEYDQTVKQIMEYRDLLAGLSAENVDIASLREKEAIQINMEVVEARKRLESLRDRLEAASRIISPRSGRVVEIFKDRGEMLGIGEPVVRLEVSDKNDDLTVTAYFSPYQGKMIKTGMPIHLTPSTVRAEEFGYVLGEVERVSLFPASRQGMLHVLGNAGLVDSLSAGGAPIMVKARLTSDPSTVSGYAWSSGEGPPLLLQAGTLCSVQVETRADPPLALVFPELKRLFFGSSLNHTP